MAHNGFENVFVIKLGLMVTHNTQQGSTSGTLLLCTSISALK